MSVTPEWAPGPRDVEAWTVPDSFRCFVSYRDQCHVSVSVTGSLDVRTAPVFTNEIETILAASVALVAVDLSDLSFMDSAGLAALVKLQSRAVEREIAFTVAAVSRQARIVFDASPHGEGFGISPDATLERRVR